MKNIIRLTLLAALLSVYLFSYAQVEAGDTLFIQRNERGIIKFVSFKTSEKPERRMENDIDFMKSLLKAKGRDEFRLKSEITDDMGITHRRYQQYFKGVRVDNAEYLVHGEDGNINIINGDFQTINMESVIPAITERHALEKALDYVGAKKYRWEEESMEAYIKQQRNSPYATYYPVGELTIAEDNLKGNNLFKLAWQFNISSLEPYDEQMIFVDATNGEVIRYIPLIWNANATGTAQTIYNGAQTITSDSYASGYRLYESRSTTTGNNAIIHTRNSENTTLTGNRPEFTSGSANWTTAGWPSYAPSKAALDVHWATEKNLDYWKTVHGRNSLNDAGLAIHNYVHFDVGLNNAGYNPNNHEIVYGDGDGIICTPWTSLDVVAHEMGHGFTRFVVALVPGDVESGALNEGFSDIWAACVKAWVNPSLTVKKDIWLVGKDIMNQPNVSDCIRNMQSPGTSYALDGYLYPSIYKGTNWNYGNNQHINSTVLSHWFYLLCEGNSSVAGIGITKAEKIAFKALLYLTPQATYSDARDATIAAAKALNNNKISVEEISVTNAWYAVGVGAKFPMPVISGSSPICSTFSQTFSVNSNWVQGSYTWAKSNNLSWGTNNDTSNSSIDVISAHTNNGDKGWVRVMSGSIIMAEYVVNVNFPAKQYVKTIPVAFNYWHDEFVPWDFYPEATSYSWTWANNYSPDVYLYQPNLQPNCASVQIYGDSSYTLYGKVNNACGSAPNTTVYFTFFIGRGGAGNSFAYPNPVDDILTIDIDALAGQSATGAQRQALTFDVRFYDGQGNLLRQQKAKGGTVQFNVSNLPDGIYYLHIYDGVSSTPQMQQIVVQH